jgi:hypothetical protein
MWKANTPPTPSTAQMTIGNDRESTRNVDTTITPTTNTITKGTNSNRSVLVSVATIQN